MIAATFLARFVASYAGKRHALVAPSSPTHTLHWLAKARAALHCGTRGARRQCVPAARCCTCGCAGATRLSARTFTRRSVTNATDFGGQTCRVTLSSQSQLARRFEEIAQTVERDKVEIPDLVGTRPAAWRHRCVVSTISYTTVAVAILHILREKMPYLWQIEWRRHADQIAHRAHRLCVSGHLLRIESANKLDVV
jgi:hypothetical protein